MQPNQSWGYKTVPQEHLNGSALSYDRGKGLGGTSSINFCKVSFLALVVFKRLILESGVECRSKRRLR